MTDTCNHWVILCDEYRLELEGFLSATPDWRCGERLP